MKKNTLGLLAGLCVLLTGCGTKYTRETSFSEAGVSTYVKETLTLGKDTFKLVEETSMSLSGSPLGSFDAYVKFAYSGTAEATDKENTYKLIIESLIVSNYTCEGDAANIGNLAMKTAFSAMFDDATVTYIMDGEKVSIENASNFLPTYVVVDPETKTFK